MFKTIAIFTLYLLSGSAQLAGKVKKNEFPPFPMTEMGKTLQTSLVLDANWRWVHNKGGYTNCYDQSWNNQFCPDPVTCSLNCELEGVELKEYKDIYGVTTSGNSATLRYVTGSNVGSRLYVLDEDKKKYKGFNLVNRELVYDIDMSQVPCGLNGALYFVEVALDGGLNDLNKAGAPYGTGYFDAQCPKDIKYIKGFVNINNTGACANEYDIWEANREANAFTPHPCLLPNGQQMRGGYPCLNDKDCGEGSNRFLGVCDKNGADYNSYRSGNLDLYGFGSQFKVNTQKPFRVVTQFITQDGTDNSDIVMMRRVYEQDGKAIDGAFLNSQVIQKDKDKYKEPNHFEQLGGFKTMTESFRSGNNIFVISLWDDLGSNGPQGPSMAWLDSVYPSNSKEPGALRGRCDPKADRSPATLRRTVPNSQYTISNLQVRAITNYPSISPSPVPSPSPKPPSPSPNPPSPSPNPPSPSPNSPSPNIQPNPQPNPSSASRIRCQECVIEEL